MKKTIFVLPLCFFLAFCSSSRKVTTPPAGPGISNVNVSRGDSMTSAANASASFTNADRDFAYKANRDTNLNGTWVLDGLLASNGSWSSTSTWNQDSTATASAATTTQMTDTAMNSMTTGTGAMTNTSGGTAGKGKKGKAKSNRRALYDSANARLNLNYRDSTVLDTTVQPFQYWKQIPSMTINASKKVFTGSTGCNTMSGSFNFTNKDIQFGRNIATSKMACNEYDESNFLSALKKADNYTLNGNMLEIRQGNTLLLTFRKA